ncbi:MAG: GIY-YIG nuclease family protein [Planctomycetales bacterium]|nr:GIY-YIG nuclease family protein [Planctomycetales bacterium]MCB0337347.1 GIY-YIG nuclease family protein [Bdellovibrionales bacterium]
MNDYYVYVYIDPRNYEEFYFGKGRGARKLWHLNDSSDSEKTRRINEIRDAGLEPIIRVVARDLTEHDALLVEKTLLWKLGKSLTNIASGHYKKNFRPHNTMHLALSGFDFQRGLYFYSVGENERRNWDDYRRYNFISAGAGPRYRDAMLGFNKGDFVVAHMGGLGFVGIAKILAEALPVKQFKVRGEPLLKKRLEGDMKRNYLEPDYSEYVCAVKWIKKVDRENAHWEPNIGLFARPIVRASLDNQPSTIEFLETAFEVSFSQLLK